MLKDVLRTIKNDMWDTLSNKKYVQAQIKKLMTEIERERKEALAEYMDLPEDEHRAYLFRTTNEAYDKRLADAIDYAYSQWHNDQSYYLIYKDGSEVVISAEEILSGAKFPKVSDVVYAEMSSADDHMDTETGDLHWYSEERMAACDWDYDVEGERVWQYETAIQFKFGTEWAQRWRQMHPEFVPVEI